jgi:ketosteroid isomerase-like protein
MTTQEIANRLVELCRKGDFETALNTLFSEDAVSIEPYATPAFEKETKGLDGLRKKGEKWNSMVQEFHSATISDPMVSGKAFCCTMQLNVTMKEGGPMNMEELCVYETKDGKIISEQFFM